MFIFVRDWPRGDVELNLIRDAGGSAVTLFHPARDGQPRVLLDSIGPADAEPEELVTLLNSFDVWAMNAANARGAACTTVNGQRSCAIAMYDYSVAMRVESRGKVRVQRYTGLETITGSRSVRAMGDYILAWANKLEAPAQMRSSP